MTEPISDEHLARVQRGIGAARDRAERRGTQGEMRLTPATVDAMVARISEQTEEYDAVRVRVHELTGGLAKSGLRIAELTDALREASTALHSVIELRPDSPLGEDPAVDICVDTLATIDKVLGP